MVRIIALWYYVAGPHLSERQVLDLKECRPLIVDRSLLTYTDQPEFVRNQLITMDARIMVGNDIDEHHFISTVK